MSKYMDKCKKDYAAKNKLNDLREEYNINLAKINKIDVKINDLKQELKKHRKIQYNYYEKILAKGIDSRFEGLSWVIKTIWNLGFDVNDCKFPSYLDDKGVKFLIKVAKMNLEYINTREKYKKIINGMRMEKLREITIKKSDVWMGVSNGILKKVLQGKYHLTKRVFEEPKVPRKLLSSVLILRKYKSQEKLMENFNLVEESNITELRSEIIKLSEEIKEFKLSEMARILKGFKYKTYDKFHITNKNQVMIGLFGDERIPLERFYMKRKYGKEKIV